MRRNERLYWARVSRGLTQAQLAEVIGVSRQMINYYENGKATPSHDTAVKLASFLRGELAA